MISSQKKASECKLAGEQGERGEKALAPRDQKWNWYGFSGLRTRGLPHLPGGPGSCSPHPFPLTQGFPPQLVKTHNLLTTRNYIFGYHPHGIMGLGAFCNFSTEATEVSKKFPGIRPYLATLAGNFRMPVLREYLMSGGESLPLPAVNRGGVRAGASLWSRRFGEPMCHTLLLCLVPYCSVPVPDMGLIRPYQEHCQAGLPSALGNPR